MSSDVWQGHRVEEYRYELLDERDRVLGDLTDVVAEGGSLSRSVYASPRDTATIPLLQRTDIDWLTHRVRISHVLHTADGEIVTPLLTGIVSAPVEDVDDDTVDVELDLADKTAILAGDAFPRYYGLADGTIILDAVRLIVATTYGLRWGAGSGGVIGDSTQQLMSPRTWDVTVTKLQIVNEILDSGGFYSLYCDGRGRYRGDRYVPPDQRPVVHHFDRGYLPQWTRDQDVANIPNQYMVVGRSDDPEVPSAIAVARDVDGRYGFHARGDRWITRPADTGVEYSSLLELQAIADRRLAAAQSVAETVTITHPFLPWVGLNQVVTVANPRLDEPLRCVVWRQSHQLALGGLVTSTMRRV